MAHTVRAHTSLLVALLAVSLAPALAVAQDDKKDDNDKKKGGELEKCEKPIGSLAVVEPQNEIIMALRRYQLQSPTSLIRMMVQQSNCFIVLERGEGMRNVMQERQLAGAGEIQEGSNLGKGQLKAADYVLTPNVIFSEGNAGGVGGAVGGILGRKVGVVGGGVKFKEAQTSILVADVRSGVQVAAAEGKAKKSNFALGGLGFLGGIGVAGGGYSNTNEGKVVAASFLDNYNAIVKAVRGDPNLVKIGADGQRVMSGTEVKAGVVFNEGDVLAPKIDNVKMLAEPKEGTRSVGMLKKGEELVYLGEDKEGYVKVQASSAEGWVKKTLVAKR